MFVPVVKNAKETAVGEPADVGERLVSSRSAIVSYEDEILSLGQFLRVSRPDQKNRNKKDCREERLQILIH